MTNTAASPRYAPGHHPNSRKNLKPPYKPGENGNPKPGNSLTARLKNALVDHPQLAEEFIQSTIHGAIKREPTPFKEVWERLEGKVPEKHAIIGEIDVVFIIGKGYRELPQGE